MNLDEIEPLKALGIELVSICDQQADFKVPLQGNKNDKGTVFAGSQYSGLVVCGWYLAIHWGRQNGLGERAAVKESKVIYPKEARTDLLVTATFDEQPDLRPSGHWRANITVVAKDAQGDIVSQHQADYRILSA